MRGLLKLGPDLGTPDVIALFATFEFFRSWTRSTYKDKSAFLDFAVGRFLSYDDTALNNGAGLLTVSEPSHRLDHVLGWAQRLLISSFPYQGRGEGYDKHHIKAFLRTCADPEFNSPGLFAGVVDLGLPLGFLYLFMLGMAAGLACRSVSLIGVLVYPTRVVTFMELFRYPYLGESRAFTAVLGMALVLVLAKFQHEVLSAARARVAARPSRYGPSQTARELGAGPRIHQTSRLRGHPMLDEDDDDVQLCLKLAQPGADAAAVPVRARRAPGLVPRLVARLYASADQASRGRLLSCLLRPLGLLAVCGISAGAFAVLVTARHSGEGVEAGVEPLANFSTAQVAELARFVQQVNPQALQQFATTWLNSGLGTTAFATAALAVLMRALNASHR